MAFKLFACFILLGAGVYAAPADSVCESTACKTLAEDLKQNIDDSVNPCDDFYDYVCSKWEKAHPLDDHTARMNAFVIRNFGVQHEINDGMKAAANSKSHAVNFLANFYLECNNTATHDARGMKPLGDVIDNVLGGWPLLKASHDPHGKHWSDVFTQLFAHTGVMPVFHIATGMNRLTHKSVLMIGPGGTGMSPNALLSPSLFTRELNAYKSYMKAAAVLMGAHNNAKLDSDIEKIIHLETLIAKELQKSPMNYVRMGSLSGLNQATNHKIDWTAWLNSILIATKSSTPHFTADYQVGAANLEFLHGAIMVLDQANEEVVQNLFGWLTVMVFGPLTTNEFRHLETLFRAAITGVKAEPPVPEYCYNIANGKLPFALARVYVDSHFTPEDKKEAEVLVKEIKSSFKKILESNTWLDEETQTYALTKLAAIRENVAYPDWVMADADLDNYYDQLKRANVVKGHFIESAIDLNTLTIRHTLDTLNAAINHTLMWPMTPATVNAAYMPTENSITIPAAILKSPFFDKSRPFSMNYGSIGAVIGHELTHGFDNKGRMFDAHGEQRNWWSQETMTEFNQKAQCMINQYGAIVEPTTHLHVNGQLTLGENIADNGGVKESFNAYHNHEANTGKSQVLPGLKYTADQLYFISYARNWCSVSQRVAMANLIQTNPHPPERYRVNVVLGNSDEFAKSFNCAAGSKMNPSHKCAVW